MPLPSEPKMAMEQVASVIRPVSVTMLFVVYCVIALCNPYSLSQADCRATGANNALSLVMVYQEQGSDSDATKLGGSLLNAALLVAMFVVITFGMYCLYKYRCMKFIWGYLGLSVGTLLAFFGYQWISQVILKYGVVVDFFTLGIVLFNWTVVGILSVFWRNPPVFGQFYLVFISSMMAWILAWMPEWTGWAILIALAVYDLFAVLCPGGPLRLLVEEAQEREERIPALVYETTLSEEERRYRALAIEGRVAQRQLADRQGGEGALHEGSGSSSDGEDTGSSEWTEETVTESGASADASEAEGAAVLVRPQAAGSTGGDSDAQRSDSSDRLDVPPAPSNADEEAPIMAQAVGNLQRPPSVSTADSVVRGLDLDDDEGQLKLGLGDFVFYSVLVGKGSAYGVATVAASFVAILMGLCMTLMALGWFQKALPALPFSIVSLLSL